MVWLVLELAQADSAREKTYVGNFQLQLGARKLTNANWGSADVQPMLGLAFDMQWDSFPVGIDAGLSVSLSNLGGGESSVGEALLGIGKLWGVEGAPIRLYAAGGMAAEFASLRVTAGKDSASAVGGYVRAGGYYTLQPKPIAYMGLDLHYVLGANMILTGRRMDADGLAITFSMGFEW